MCSSDLPARKEKKKRIVYETESSDESSEEEVIVLKKPKKTKKEVVYVMPKSKPKPREYVIKSTDELPQHLQKYTPRNQMPKAPRGYQVKAIHRDIDRYPEEVYEELAPVPREPTVNVLPLENERDKLMKLIFN